MTKPQNVKKCASPGTDHLSSRRWPSTSPASLATRVPPGRPRSGAAAPEEIRLTSQRTRRPAITTVATVISRVRVMRRATTTSSVGDSGYVGPEYARLPTGNHAGGAPN